MTAENIVKMRVYDVFLSFAGHNVRFASEVEVKLSASGLSVFNPVAVWQPSFHFQERLREELAASSVMVAVFEDKVQLSSNLAFEIGAAMAWKKPVYGIKTPEALIDPAIPHDIRLYDLDRIDEVAVEIRAVSKPLTEEQGQKLAQVYANIGTSTDGLTRDPEAVAHLTEQFNSLAKTRLSGERLLRELLVLRKRGNLPRLRNAGGRFRQPA
jgi:hypothetical protein